MTAAVTTAWSSRTPLSNSAQLPVLEWFIDDAGYNGLLQPFCDQVEYPGVITWQGQVFDNATFRRRGHSSCNDPKPKVEMQLPAGYAIDFSPFASGNAAPFTGPLDEWALQNEAYPIPGLGWENIRQVGDPAVGYMPVRVQRNGAFFGASMILEEYDGSWRSRKGYDNGAFYKVEAGGLRTYSTPTELYNSADFDKKDPEDTDYTDVWQLTQMLNQPSSPAKTAWIYANLDVPQIVNYTALTVALRHWDSGGKNFYLYRGTGNTDRWQILHWDLDGIFSGGSDSKGDFVTPDVSFNKLYASIFEIPAIREMHFRRLRTLHDQYLVGNGFVNQFDALTVGKDADRVLNKAKWGGPTLSTSRNKVVNGVQERRNQIAAHTNANEVPTSQSANPAVVINEIHYKPGTATGSEEFLELYNPSTTEAVDISGWRLKGLGSSDARVADPTRHGDPQGRLCRVRERGQRVPRALRTRPLRRRPVPRRLELQRRADPAAAGGDGRRPGHLQLAGSVADDAERHRPLAGAEEPDARQRRPGQLGRQHQHRNPQHPEHGVRGRRAGTRHGMRRRQPQPRLRGHLVLPGHRR